MCTNLDISQIFCSLCLCSRCILRYIVGSEVPQDIRKYRYVLHFCFRQWGQGLLIIGYVSRYQLFSSLWSYLACYEVGTWPDSRKERLRRMRPVKRKKAKPPSSKTDKCLLQGKKCYRYHIPEGFGVFWYKAKFCREERGRSRDWKQNRQVSTAGFSFFTSTIYQQFFVFFPVLSSILPVKTGMCQS